MDIFKAKNRMRREMEVRRRAIPEAQRLQAGRIVGERFRRRMAESQFRTVFLYINVWDELPTEELLTALLADSTRNPDRLRVVVPYCDGDQLGLFRLESELELEPGRFGIREPRVELRHEPSKQIRPEEIELYLIPGVAFDVQCRRLGRGGGFFDRLLPKVPRTSVRLGAAFDDQIVLQIPCEDHDCDVDGVLTPTYEIQAK